MNMFRYSAISPFPLGQNCHDFPDDIFKYILETKSAYFRFAILILKSDVQRRKTPRPPDSVHGAK